MWTQHLSKLTDEQKSEVWTLRDSGHTLDQLATRYRVSISTIGRILRERPEANDETKKEA